MMKVTPDTQKPFALNPKAALMGDYPTLNDIDAAYGIGFSTEWLVPQLDNLSRHAGAKNLTEEQQVELAGLIAVEYRHLKITELLLFFHRFKAGQYGHFYGTVDPMVITCALKDFMRERGEMIERFMQEEAEERRQREMRENPPITREEWERIKNEIKQI